MEQSMNLVSAMRLDTEFLSGAHKHRRQIEIHPISDSETHIENIDEIWDKEDYSFIGSGSFGHVWFERRRPQVSDLRQAPHNQVRAVKQVRKLATPNYIQELRAIATFSQDPYKSYFVQSFGWFEDPDSIYITMEYLRLGDLARFRRDHGRFTEISTSVIMRQVLEGIGHMHDINFAHRDLKPANILVASINPWRVKLADFGVSKQLYEATQLQTQTGTPAYQAPELREPSRDSDADTYSLSVDIWAIGVITMELVLDHPFLYGADQRDYVEGRRSLSFDEVPSVTVSTVCQDLITGLLAPDAKGRPTVKDAISHSWFTTATEVLGEEASSTQNRAIWSQRRHNAVISPREFAPWSPPTLGNLHIMDSPLTSELITRSSVISHSTRSLGSSHSTQTIQTNFSTQSSDTSILGTYHGRAFNSRILVRSFQDLSLDNSKYFVMRSDNEPDMEICLAENRWIGKRQANVKINNGYRRSGGNVIIFFSIVKSRRFCGVARMTSAVDWENTDDDWLPREDGEEYEGRFEIEWLTVNELHFDQIQHVPARLGTRRKAVACMDGFELASESGYEILRVYSEIIRQKPTRYDLV